MRGPVSVLVALLGRVRLGGAVSAGAFWPQPKVASRMVRIDFDAAGADAVRNVDVLAAAVRVPFEQRRKQMASAARRKTSPFPPQRFTEGLAAAGIDPTARPEQIPPKQFLDLANFLSA